MNKLPEPRNLGLPFDEWRPPQERALRWLEETELTDTHVMFLEAPTSFGKSAIAIAMQDMSHVGGPSLICTGTKQLVSQYRRDSNAMVEIRGRRNYPCPLVDHPCINSRVDFSYDRGACLTCAYVRAKSRAVASPHVVTTYDYALSELNYVGSFRGRKWLIADEAHTLETHLLGLLELSLTDELLNAAGLELPSLDLDDLPSWQNWAQAARLVCRLKLAELEEAADAFATDNQIRRLESQLAEFAQDSSSNWFLKLSGKGLLVSPVWAAAGFNRLFREHALKVLLMSATILSVEAVANMLGVVEPYRYHSFEGSIVHTDRPLYYSPVIRLGGGQSSPDDSIIEYVDSLIAAYYPLPVLIHTVNYRLRDLVTKRSRFRQAMLSHSIADREVIFARYAASEGFSVLVSPSLGLGVDFPFKQGLQIILKVPFPDLGDKRVQIRKQQNPSWYSWATVANLCQIYGRGSRMPGHLCDTWCLDANYGWFKNSNMGLFPLTFRQAEVKVPPDDFHIIAKQRGTHVRNARGVYGLK